MTDSEFLDDIEARIPRKAKQMLLTPTEYLRLYGLGGREWQNYAAKKPRRRAVGKIRMLIKDARQRILMAITDKLEGRPTWKPVQLFQQLPKNTKLLGKTAPFIIFDEITTLK
jgi:hypothetical protein